MRDVKQPVANVGGWSVTKYAVAGEEPPPPIDTTAPTPNPMTWAPGLEPYKVSNTSIGMTAATATDASGVEYEFQCVEDANFSRIQDDTNYTATGLTVDGVYTFRVRARDKSVNQNETAWSTPPVTVDLGAVPLPSLQAPVISPDSPSQDGTTGDWWYHHMFADISGIDGDGSQVYIKFACTDEPDYSSDWEPISATGSVDSGLFLGTITFANDRIDYDAKAGWGDSYGYERSWKVCVSYSSDGSGEVLCSSIITIEPVIPFP